MKLQWCRYLKGSEPVRYILLLELGTAEGKLHCLEADSLSAGDAHTMRIYKDLLDELELAQKYSWIKEKCPSATRCYRTIPLAHLQVIREYQIPGISIPNGLATALDQDLSLAATPGTGGNRY